MRDKPTWYLQECVQLAQSPAAKLDENTQAIGRMAADELRLRHRQAFKTLEKYEDKSK